MSDTVNPETAQLKALAQLFGQLWNDPEHGETIQRAAKKHKPDITILDDNPVVVKTRAQLAEMETKTTALQTAFDEYRAGAEREKAESKLRESLGKVQTQFGFSDEKMADVIKTMQDRQLVDPEAAALIVREAMPKTPPQSASSKFFDTKADMWGTTRRDEKWEKLHTDPDGFFADVVNEVFTEMPAA